MEIGIVGTGGNRVEVESSGVIDAPLENLWQLLSDFNNIAQWHPDVAESHLESGTGREAGSVRSIRLRNGISVRERLLAISPQDHSYRYSVIESPLPIRDHESTVRLASLNNSQTHQMTWTAKFEVIEGDPKAVANDVRTGVLDLGIEGLRRAVALK
jgi:hypothetical protein